VLFIPIAIFYVLTIIKMFTQLLDTMYSGTYEKSQLEYWDTIDLSKKVENAGDPNKLYRFMDGPPFVSGDPHLGHLAVWSMKSTTLNYQRQRGKMCLNRLGYDCHGLPVENRIAKEKNLETIADIEKVGIDQFCKWCKEMIDKYSNPSNPDSWPPLMRRLGRWADYSNTYRTMDVEFMESTWHVFKTMFDKDLVYMGYKVVPYSWACQTSLSNFEASQNYKEKNTKSVYVMFPVIGEDDTYFVAWTTTAWTLPSNMALCVGEEIEYVKVDVDNKYYYVSKNTYEKVFGKGKCKIVETMKGSDLTGKRYTPIFDCFRDEPGLFVVVADSYVKDTEDSGTGIVHQSPPFGEEDYDICVKNGLVTNTTVQNFCTVDEFGKFNDLVPMFKGQNVCDSSTTINIIIELKRLGVFIKTDMYKHNYPYCWRTDTPLIYRVVKSVFIKVTSLKDQMIALNDKINWHPRAIGEKRFKDWLANARDWAVSRSRYFGTPIPLWVSSDGDMLCIGSRQELADFTGKSAESYSDIHKELMDKETFTRDGKVYTRIPDIFDCWFESGCVPFGQIHYPFENRELIDSVDHLSDLVIEGLDQTRGWFYTLLVVATAMTDGKKVPFKNVICTGMVLDSQGRKISKRLGNYVDINQLIDKYGVDVLRTYLVGSPLVNANPLLCNPDALEIIKGNQIRYINGVRFFLEHSSNYQKNGNTFMILGDAQFEQITNVFDKWIMGRLTDLSRLTKNNMEDYKLDKVVHDQTDFVEDLLNWYLKFNRSRMKGLCGTTEWMISLSVLHYVIHNYARLCAPVTPFISEYVHRNIYLPVVPSAPESIHFMEYPEINFSCESLHTVFGYLKRICETVRAMRDKSKYHTTVRMPIKRCVVYHNDATLLAEISSNIAMVNEDINCITIDYRDLGKNVKNSIKPNFKTIGKEFTKFSTKIVKILKEMTSEEIASLDETSMCVTVDGVEYKLTSDHYTISREPVSSESELVTTIVGDVMIGIDFTIDDEVAVDYITKCVHSSIQNTRKKMDLHPWDKVVVKLNSSITSRVSDIDTRLKASLTNSDVVLTEEGTFETVVSIKVIGELYDVSYSVERC
jgi:isoleucyl-tRNA synthetase